MELLFSDFFLEMHISCFFNFMLGNATIDQFPGWEQSGKSGKFFAVSWISIWNYSIGAKCQFLQMVKAFYIVCKFWFALKIQILVNFDQILVNFGQYLEIFQESNKILLHHFLFPGFLPGNVQLYFLHSANPHFTTMV